MAVTPVHRLALRLPEMDHRFEPGAADHRRIDDLPALSHIAAGLQSRIEQREQLLDRTGLHQILPQQPDRLDIGNPAHWASA